MAKKAKEYGYFYFLPDDIIIKADTSIYNANDKLVDVYISVDTSLSELHYKKMFVSRINVHQYSKGVLSDSTLKRRYINTGANYMHYFDLLHYRPSFLERNVRLNSDSALILKRMKM